MDQAKELQFKSYFDLVDRQLGPMKAERPKRIKQIDFELNLARQYNAEILGLTAMAGNGTLEDVVMNAQLILDAAEAPEIPIFRGEKDYLHPFGYDHPHYGPDGFGGYQLEQRDSIKLSNVSDKAAVDFLIETAAKYPGEVTVICLAPLTNIAVALRKDPAFAGNVRDFVMLGGTYLAQGNTRFNCSEFNFTYKRILNFLKDPEAADIVFSLCQNLTMVPIEVSRSFRALSQEYVRQAFEVQTKKGQLIKKSFQIVYKNSEGHYYEVVDPCAIIVAIQNFFILFSFCPELVEEYYEKPCLIQQDGKYTRGMVVIDWIG